jgi:hypothetical protein
LTSDNSGQTQLVNEDRIFAGAGHIDPEKRPLLLLVLDEYTPPPGGGGGTGTSGGTGTAKPGGTGSMKVK